MLIRDRPFNLQGGGYGFLFRSEFFFRTTQELEYYFFLSRKAQIFFPKCNIWLYDKNSKLDYFFFLHQNQNIFFSNIGNQNIFLEKTITPPFKLNGRTLMRKTKIKYPWKSITTSKIRIFAMVFSVFHLLKHYK
jgi:hypothetical protein